MNRARKIIDLCNAAIRELEGIKASADDVAYRVDSDSFGGLPSGSNEEKRRAKGGTEVGIGPALTNQLNDDVTLNWKAFVAALESVKTAAVQASMGKARLTAISLAEAQRLTQDSQHSPGKHCDNQACARWVANTRSDRIRAGRCPACYEYRRTHDGKDRTREMIEPTREPEGPEGPAPEFYRDLHAVKDDVA